MGKHFFESLEIKNFRGVSEGEIKNFSSINLFVGGNGCGKTTVLESLFLLTGISNPDLMVTTQGLRGVIPFEPGDMRDFFFDLDEGSGLSLKGVLKSEAREVEVSPVYSVFRDDRPAGRNGVSANGGPQPGADRTLSGLQYEFSVTDLKSREIRKYSAETIAGEFRDLSEMTSPGFHRTVEEEYEEELRANIICSGANCLYRPPFVNAMVKEQKDILLESLRIVKPEVVDMRVDFMMRVFVDIGSGRFFPVGLLGDGLLSVLNAVSTIHCTGSGIVMIDRIDSGLHVSRFKGLWKILMELSRRYDAQIFMTTHSKDVIEGLVALYKEERPLFSGDDDIACFYLDKNEERRVKGYRYSTEQLRQVLVSNTDIRK